MDLTTGAVDTLLVGSRGAYSVGYLLFSLPRGPLLAQPFDPRLRRTTGSAVTLLSNTVGRPSYPAAEFALDQRGGLAYFPQPGLGQPIGVLRRGEPARVEVAVGNTEDLDLSPDGRRIAYHDASAGGSDLWIFDRDRRTPERFTEGEGSSGTPVWTPDGKRIAFSRGPPQGLTNIYWKASDGTDTVELLLETPYSVWPQSWTPDGRTLAFTAERNGGFDIGYFTQGDAELRWILDSEFDELHPQFSPDGRWLAYTSDRSGERNVEVMGADGVGTRYRVSLDGGHSPRWSPTEDVLYYEEGMTSIVRASFSDSDGFTVTSKEEWFHGFFEGEDRSVAYDVAPDGEEIIAILLPGGQALQWILGWPQILEGMSANR